SIIKFNSSKNESMVLLFTAAIPMPSKKARINAVIISITGGISTSKNAVAASLAPSATSSPVSLSLIKVGSKFLATKYAMIPAKIVEPYANTVARPNNFPDPCPSFAIPGTINPIMINGTTKFKKPPNNILKVAKNRTNRFLNASLIFGTRNFNSILKIFIFYHLYFYFSSSLLNDTNITHKQNKKPSPLVVSCNQKQVIQELFLDNTFFSPPLQLTCIFLLSYWHDSAAPSF